MSETSGEVFNDFVDELVAAEDKRRDSIESRGMSVITVSGTLVTLLLALAALVTKQQSFRLTAGARDLLVAAVLAFGGSAVLAIATYIPRPTRATDPNTLLAEIQQRWGKPPDSARKKTIATRIEYLQESRRSNNWKAAILLAAMLVQVAALVLLALSVYSTLRVG